MIRALAITGPTASGKTAISIELARALFGEIICCDSMQIYRGMDIGTAKPTEEERRKIPHHMTDFLSPTEAYSAGRYREEALRVAREIEARGALPIFVGGTGLYIDTVIRPPATDSPPSDPEVRAALTARAAEEGGADALYARLSEVDPESALAIHKNNLKRVIRALEIYELTGRKKSDYDKISSGLASDVRVGMITLDFHNRENLYRRVDARVEEMVAGGLASEARALYDAGLLSAGSTAAQAIGYKELIPYLKGEEDIFWAKEKIKLSTRQYAKRQLTWFRHETEAERLYLDTEDGVMRSTEEILAEAKTLAEGLLNKLFTTGDE